MQATPFPFPALTRGSDADRPQTRSFTEKAPGPNFDAAYAVSEDTLRSGVASGRDRHSKADKPSGADDTGTPETQGPAETASIETEETEETSDLSPKGIETDQQDGSPPGGGSGTAIMSDDVRSRPGREAPPLPQIAAESQQPGFRTRTGQQRHAESIDTRQTHGPRVAAATHGAPVSQAIQAALQTVRTSGPSPDIAADIPRSSRPEAQAADPLARPHRFDAVNSTRTDVPVAQSNPLRGAHDDPSAVSAAPPNAPPGSQRSARGSEEGWGSRSMPAANLPPVAAIPAAPVASFGPSAAGGLRSATPATAVTNHRLSVVDQSHFDPSEFLRPSSDPGLPVELRANASPATLPVLARPETPVHVARQMADALHRLPDRPVELTLNPEELGRVRMTLATHDAGITVTIVAERADTLDLMRRHIDQLNREFQDLGFDNIAFSFAGGQRGDDPDTPERDGPRAEGDKVVPSQPAIAAHSLSLGPADGLDLRL